MMSCDWKRWVMTTLRSEEHPRATPAKPVCLPTTVDMRSVRYCCLPLYLIMGMLSSSEGSNCYFEPLQSLQRLQQMMGNEGDIELYCPDLSNIENCGKETLQCFQAELNVLNFEFAGTSKKNVTHLITILIKQFDNYLLHLDKSNGCQRCEIYKEEPAMKFLNNLEIFMHYQNKNKCTP